jgi:hypothetical protein
MRLTQDIFLCSLPFWLSHIITLCGIKLLFHSSELCRFCGFFFHNNVQCWTTKSFRFHEWLIFNQITSKGSRSAHTYLITSHCELEYRESIVSLIVFSDTDWVRHAVNSDQGEFSRPRVICMLELLLPPLTPTTPTRSPLPFLLTRAASKIRSFIPPTVIIDSHSSWVHSSDQSDQTFWACILTWSQSRSFLYKYWQKLNLLNWKVRTMWFCEPCVHGRTETPDSKDEFNSDHWSLNI